MAAISWPAFHSKHWFVCMWSCRSTFRLRQYPKAFPTTQDNRYIKISPQKYPLLPPREKLVPWPPVDRAAGEMDSQGSLSQAATLDRTRPPQSKRAQQTCSPVEEDYALLTFPPCLAASKCIFLSRGHSKWSVWRKHEIFTDLFGTWRSQWVIHITPTGVDMLSALPSLG